MCKSKLLHCFPLDKQKLNPLVAQAKKLGRLNSILLFLPYSTCNTTANPFSLPSNHIRKQSNFQFPVWHVKSWKTPLCPNKK